LYFSHLSFHGAFPFLLWKVRVTSVIMQRPCQNVRSEILQGFRGRRSSEGYLAIPLKMAGFVSL
jgi:hypothetical protein